MQTEWTFHDSEGRAVAYCDDGVHLHLFDGRAVAYLNGSSVYSYEGCHLGWFLRGWIRDHQGDAVLFAEGTVGDGPPRPERWPPPERGRREERPAKGNPEMHPGPPATSRSWSQLDSEGFFRLAPAEEAAPAEAEPTEPTPEDDGEVPTPG
jgi:hypothetical protein